MNRVAQWLTVLTLAGCDGAITSGVTAKPVEGIAGEKPNEPVLPRICDVGAADAAGPKLLRRLTTPEWEASVRENLSLTAAVWIGSTLPPDAAGKNGFTNSAERLVVNDTYAERMFESSKAIGVLIAAEPRLSSLLPCAAAANEACARTWLETIGRRIYRRPLTDPEKQRYLALYARVVPRLGFPKWVQWATTAALQSPHVLYRSELGGVSSQKLTADEIATALSFTFVGGPPDEALLRLAAEGKLQTREQVQAAARGLVFDAEGKVKPRAREMLLGFERQWMNLSKLEVLSKRADKYPLWNDTIRSAMRFEIEAFFTHVVADKKGTVSQLLTSPVTFVDANLATYYGFAAPAAGNTAPTQRPVEFGVGLLAQGAFLAIRANSEASSPTQRGHFVRSHLLCVDPPPPPANIGSLPPPTATNTTRERYETGHAAKGCAGCHKGFDPIGFALEGFDSGGRYRTHENGFPINDAAVLSLDGKQFAFKGPGELAAFVAKDPRSSECVAAYLSSYAFGLDHHDTPCLSSSATKALVEGGSIVEYFVALAGTSHFLERAP